MGTVTDIHAKIPTDNLAARLKLLRNEMGWSQREAAARTGVHYGTWQGMEAGRETRALDRHVVAIATASGYDRDWLMWGGPLSTPAVPKSPNIGGPGITVELTRRLRVVRSDSRLSLVRQTAA